MSLLRLCLFLFLFFMFIYYYFRFPPTLCSIQMCLFTYLYVNFIMQQLVACGIWYNPGRSGNGLQFKVVLSRDPRDQCCRSKYMIPIISGTCEGRHLERMR